MKTWNKLKETKIYILVEKTNVNNIRYVGKTCQKLEQRLYQHIYSAKYPKYNSKNNLRHVVNWIRAVNFNIEIKQIDSVNDWTEGENLEKFYIKKFKNEKHNLCNLTIGGDGATPKYGSDNNNSKEVLQYSLEGVFIKKFNSRAEAELETGVKQSLICGCINIPRIKSAGGYIWTNHIKNYPLNIQSYTRKIKKDTAETSCKIRKYSKTNVFLEEYSSIHEGARLNNLNHSNLRKSLQGKLKSCGGFIWKRV